MTTMTITDAIRHAEEKAQSSNSQCAKEHSQLAAWLSELVTLRESQATLAAPSAVAWPSISQVTEQMRTAGDHTWMTSDGVDSARVFWAMLAAAPTTQPGTAYAALPDDDRDYMRKVVAVAVTMLFDGYKGDVTRVFSPGELSEFVTITAAMGGERVEDIYRRAWDLLSLPVRTSHGQASAQAAPQPLPASQENELDTARLDWLDKNIFYREMPEWDAKHGHGSSYNMWVLFAPKVAQGSARKIIDAARAAQEGKSHG